MDLRLKTKCACAYAYAACSAYYLLLALPVPFLLSGVDRANEWYMVYVRMNHLV